MKYLDIKWKDRTLIGSDDSMIPHSWGDVSWFSFPSFDRRAEIRHGFSTRLGGVSTGDLASLNLSFSRGDLSENVQKNFSLIGDAIGLKPENMVFSEQEHTTNVRRVGTEDRGCGITRPLTWTDVDGLVTDEPEVVLTTFYADCVPLFFYDPVHRAIGLSHSGWRGTAAGMGHVTVERMKAEFSTEPGDLICAIGPSVCGECYEVGPEVAAKFSPAYVREKDDGKYLLNLQEANRAILIDSGVPREHISLPNLCTCCNPDIFYSHRASHGRRGTQAGFLEILPVLH